MRALVLAAFALLAASAAGCTQESVLVRDVSGTVKSPAGHTITEVVMMDPIGGQEATGQVDSAGNFSVAVYDSGQGVVRVLFKESGQVIGVLGSTTATTGRPRCSPSRTRRTPVSSPRTGRAAAAPRRM